MWKLGDQNVLLISFLSHAPVAIHDRHYINGSKIGQHLITNGVYIMFVCLFVVHRGDKCTQGTWKWKHMIYGHFLSEFESLNNDSFVNFEILILGFEKMFETLVL